jgi:pimeloyl-ACP methyl ester carboxylesterase
VTLRYWEAGAGRALVMLPGLGHAASLYKYQLEGLCDEFRVIALDPRGHGESDKPEAGYNYHTLAKDLDGFLRALDLNDVTILGHSGGCKIILTYLELYGELGYLVDSSSPDMLWYSAWRTTPEAWPN